jgi:L-serine dehydratase
MGEKLTRKVSIFNEVIGPVMRGPSSSHTAASYHIGSLVRNLLDNEPAVVDIIFTKNGSYAAVYHQQGSDRGFATGLLGWKITDDRFLKALKESEKAHIKINFRVEALVKDDHPNAIEILGESRSGCKLTILARSIGGGAIELRKLNDWPIHLMGDAYDVLIELRRMTKGAVVELLSKDVENLEPPSVQSSGDRMLIHFKASHPLKEGMVNRLRSLPGIINVWMTSPVFFPQPGEPLFTSGEEMIDLALKNNCSLGRLALSYEAKLLGISEDEASKEMFRRYEIMREAMIKGLDRNLKGMQLLQPSAGSIIEAERTGRTAIGGIHTRAAARALSVMHVDCAMGVVCAAPTGGSAGTIPGVITTLAEEKNLTEEQIVLAMFAASTIGLILAIKGTFAAEVAGCQVEIGAAGAMSAAAVIEVAGGTAQQACDAAAISFQNTMGSVCDLVQGMVEIPCHTRNAVAASSAFVCADLILGGYINPIPLDETIDAVMSVGNMLPPELRCTALGGLAITPSALAMKPKPIAD